MFHLYMPRQIYSYLFFLLVYIRFGSVYVYILFTKKYVESTYFIEMIIAKKDIVQFSYHTSTNLKFI